MDLKFFSNQYLEVIQNELKGLNLTRITEEDAFYQKQILDSVLPAQKIKSLFYQLLTEYKVCLDVGFGGGFPILPLAYCMREVQFVGIEARRKKVEAVQLLARKLGIDKNVNLRHARLEDLVIDRPCVITLKAVGSCENFLKNIHATITEFAVFFYKGPEYLQQEGAYLNSEKFKASWELREVFPYEVKGTEGRFLLGISPKKSFHSSNKELVNLSDIL